MITCLMHIKVDSNHVDHYDPVNEQSLTLETQAIYHFYCATLCERGLGSRNSVRPSISHTCFVTIPQNLPSIYLYFVKGQSFQFSATQLWLVGDVPFHLKWTIEVTHPFKNCSRRQISACNVSTVRASGKKFNYDEQEVVHGLSNELQVKCVRYL